MAGAFTESTVIGTASDTIDRLDLPEAEKTRLLNNIPVAYAVSYLVGTGFIVWFLSVLAPRLLRVDLKAESRKLDASVVGGSDLRSKCAPRRTGSGSVRAYRLADVSAGRTRRRFRDAPRGRSGVFVERIRRGAALLDAEAGHSSRRQDDVVAIAARRRVLLGGIPPLRDEVEDRAAPRLSDGQRSTPL